MIRSPFMFWLSFCLCLVLGSVLVYQMQQGSGYVLLVWGKTSIEMSLWFGLIVLLLVVAVIWLLLYVLRGSLRGLVSAKNKLVNYSSHRAQEHTTEGLIHFIEGDWLPAYKKLTRSASKVTSPIINYLAAARCAYESGNEQKALELLHQAQKSTSNSDLAVALTQARMQLANQQYEQALATLQRAAKANPNHHVVLNLTQQVYVALKDWGSLKSLLPKLHQQDIGTVKERYYLEQTLYRSLFKEQIQKQAAASAEEKRQALDASWQSIPEHFQKDEALLCAYVRELMDLTYHDEAEAVLAKSLSQQWYDSWVALYGLLTVSVPAKTLTTAEAWLKTRDKNPTLLLTVGRLCLQNQQWGRAKGFLKESLAINPTPQAYAELARLQDFLGDKLASHHACRQGLLLSIKEQAPVADFKKS